MRTHKKNLLISGGVVLIMLLSVSSLVHGADWAFGITGPFPHLIGPKVKVDFNGFGIQLDGSYLISGAILRPGMRFNKHLSDSFNTYGFLGNLMFLNLESYELHHNLNFGVGAEWGKRWIFGLEGGLSFELKEPGEESDTIGMTILVSIMRRL